MRGFFLLAILLLFDLGMPSAFAAVSSNASDQTASSATNRCGPTVADAVKQARLSLRSNDAGSERAALACLIEAVSQLNAQAAKTPAADGHLVLSVPSYSGPME
jgi:hypothetical protein